jgi:methylated-DNA-protein-cysteine methyltransferase-like protein
VDVKARAGKLARPRPRTQATSRFAGAVPQAGSSFRQRVYAWIGRIPRGRVATYGQISALAGHPRRARMVGQALARLPPGRDLPWHRVVNAQGRVSPRGSSQATARRPSAENRQRKLLEAEGVIFRRGRIDLIRFRWVPEVSRLRG